MPFADRREILEACRYVDRVEPSPEDYAAHVDAVDLLVRGDVADPAWIPAVYQSFIAAGKLVVLGRTEGVSSTDLADRLGEPPARRPWRRRPPAPAGRRHHPELRARPGVNRSCAS